MYQSGLFFLIAPLLFIYNIVCILLNKSLSIILMTNQLIQDPFLHKKYLCIDLSDQAKVHKTVYLEHMKASNLL